MAAPSSSSNKNTSSAKNVTCETPSEVLSSNVVARKALAITMVRASQLLNVSTALVGSSQRQPTARFMHITTRPNGTNIAQVAVRGNRPSILVPMTNVISKVSSIRFRARGNSWLRGDRFRSRSREQKRHRLPERRRHGIPRDPARARVPSGAQRSCLLHAYGCARRLTVPISCQDSDVPQSAYPPSLLSCFSTPTGWRPFVSSAVMAFTIPGFF